MRKIILAILTWGLLSGFTSSKIQATTNDFSQNFADSTLRVDYVFGGGPEGIHIMLDKQSKSEGWAGRRSNLKGEPHMVMAQ